MTEKEYKEREGITEKSGKLILEASYDRNTGEVETSLTLDEMSTAATLKILADTVNRFIESSKHSK